MRDRNLCRTKKVHFTIDESNEIERLTDNGKYSESTVIRGLSKAGMAVGDAAMRREQEKPSEPVDTATGD